MQTEQTATTLCGSEFVSIGEAAAAVIDRVAALNAGSARIQGLYEEWKRSKNAYDAHRADDDEEARLRGRMEAAEAAFFQQPCRSEAEVAAKARIILADPYLLEVAEEDRLGDGTVVAALLRSFIAGAEEEDAVVQIGRALGRVARQRADLEKLMRSESDPDLQRRYRLQEVNASDKVLQLRDLLTHHQATTCAGAAVQLSEIHNRLHLIHDDIPEDAASGDLEANMRAFQRLAFSILGVLSALSDEQPEDITYPGFVNQHLNPWSSMGAGEKVAQA